MLFALAPASDLAVALVNRTVTKMLGPKPLPRLDLDDGVPSRSADASSPSRCCSPSEAEVEELVGGLEVHYLANREGDLRFALLSDWLDADTEEVPGDDELLAAAAAAIDQLNERHGEAPGGGARFLLLAPQAAMERGRGLAGWVGNASAASSRN